MGLSNNAANPTATTTNQENGGAVTYAGPTLTVSGSTFSNNTASGGGGGMYAYEGFFGSYLTGAMTFTNSTFTNNTNVITGGAIDFSLHGGSSASITGSTFTGNKTTEAAGNGGAINAETFDTTAGDATFTMSNSRIVGNSAPGAGTGVAAVFVTATLTNNWWGCNAGPGSSGCDSIFNDGSTVTSSPWLVLSISASPNQIDTSATSTLTADLTHNSNGVGGFSVPNGPVVTFSGGSLGSASSPATLFDGTATSTFTAGGTAGNATATATVDNATADTTINILDTVTVTTSPAGLLVSADGSTPAAAPQTFHWVVGSPHTIATTSPQNVSGGSEQVFSSWSDGTLTTSDTVTAPAATTTYTANFTQEYQLTTQASPSAGGSVTPVSGGYYAGGAIIPVTATANAGFQFSNWTTTGGSFGSTTSASTNFTMPSAPATVTGNFTLIVTGAQTTTSVASNNNPSFTTTPGNSVTFTATVTSTSTVNEGTVTFTDGINNLTCSGGNPAAVSNGQAQCTTLFTVEGAHAITATYNGTVNFVTSNGSVSQVVNNHTVVTGNQFCNPGPITIPSTPGAATPYPSNVFVTGLSGTVGKVTVALHNISSSDIAQTDMLLVGPTGAAIIPFAAVGDGSTISGVNITLDDTAASLIPGGSPLTSGTYKPTSITGSTSLVFPSPAPTVVAGDYAATDGSVTLTSQFQSTAPNETWALYAMDNSGSGAGTIGGGWCLNFTENAVSVTATKAHSGNFTQGQQGAQFTLNITNNGPGATGDPDGSHPLTVVDVLAAGFTPAAPTGTSWSCSAVGQTVTCTSDLAVAQGNSYPTLTIPVNVSPTAGASASNQVSVSGGGVTSTNSNTDTVTINPAPVLAVAKSHPGSFTAGQTAEWDIAVSNTAASSSITTGTVTVSDTLPTGYTLNSYTGSGWSCSGSSTVTCTSTQGISGGASFPTIALTVSVPTNSPSSVTNTVSAFGGGDLVHVNLSTGASGSDSVTVNPATVQVTVTTSPGGLLVSVDGGTATAAPLVETWSVGSSHTIATSSPQSGGTGVQYVWSSWSDGGALSHSITVPSTATTYTANFTTQYQLTTQASPSADGSVTPASGNYYAASAVVPVTATANAGFQFSNWTSTGGSFGSTTSPSTNFTMPSAPATVTGNFTASTVPITITTSPANLLVSVDGGTFTAAPLVETWNIGSSHTIATTSPQAGGTGVQYVWNNWSDAGAISHSITVPSNATSYTANFTTQYQLTTQASPSADGTVTPASGGYYAGGAIIPVTATANAGFQFSNWTSTGGTFDSANAASTNFHMPTAATTVKANFSPKPFITTQPTNQTVCEGTKVTFTAAAGGVPTPTVQWQVSIDGGAHWLNIPGAKSTTLTFPAIVLANGTEYRAVFTNTFGTAATNAATLTVDFDPQIISQPNDQHVKKGHSVTFTAAAIGRPTPTVQWQVSTNGGKTWTNISAATSTKLTFTAAASQDNNRYRAVFTDTCGTATTRAATLDVD